jgi:hypothetical protein
VHASGAKTSEGPKGSRGCEHYTAKARAPTTGGIAALVARRVYLARFERQRRARRRLARKMRRRLTSHTPSAVSRTDGKKSAVMNSSVSG